MRARRLLLVDVKALRIAAPRERLDTVGGEGVAAGHDDVADKENIEETHGAPPGVRRPIIKVLIMVVTGASASSIISNVILMKPVSGRLFDARVSSTVDRIRT